MRPPVRFFLPCPPQWKSNIYTSAQGPGQAEAGSQESDRMLSQRRAELSRADRGVHILPLAQKPWESPGPLHFSKGQEQDWGQTLSLKCFSSCP
jgi:hypothetical protein